MLASRPVPQQEDHLLSAVRNCVFNVFTATIRNCRRSFLSSTRGHDVPCCRKHWMLKRNKQKWLKRCGMDFTSICSINLVYFCNPAQTVLVPQVASQERHRLEIALSRLSSITLNPFRSVQQLVLNAVISLSRRSLSVS